MWNVQITYDRYKTLNVHCHHHQKLQLLSQKRKKKLPRRSCRRETILIFHLLRSDLTKARLIEPQTRQPSNYSSLSRWVTRINSQLHNHDQTGKRTRKEQKKKSRPRPMCRRVTGAFVLGLSVLESSPPPTLFIQPMDGPIKLHDMYLCAIDRPVSLVLMNLFVSRL